MNDASVPRSANPFDGAEIISCYTRQDAVDDGTIVPLSGPHYPAEGDRWIPQMVAEAGFTCPVALTAAAFQAYVLPIEGDGERLAPCQDAKGRLWDVLCMTRVAVRRAPATENFVTVVLRVVPNIPIGSNRRPRAELVKLWAVLDGDGLTIMRPEDY